MARHEVVVHQHADASTPIALAEASLKDIQPAAMPDMLVCVGDTIDTDMQEGFLRCDQLSSEGRVLESQHVVRSITKLLPARRGHGTHVVDGRLVATVCGLVERVNKLVSVRPLRQRWVSGVPADGSFTAMRTASHMHATAAAQRGMFTGILQPWATS